MRTIAVPIQLGLALALAGGSAAAFDQSLALEPPNTRSGIGYGYDSVARRFVPSQCAVVGPKRTRQAGEKSPAQLSIVMTDDQLSDEMDLGVQTKLSFSLGVSASTTAKIKFASKTKTNLSSTTVLATHRDIEGIMFADGDILLKPEYQALVDKKSPKYSPAAFRQQCGDYLIAGEETGREFYGTVQLTLRDTKSQTEFAHSVGAKASGFGLEFSADENSVKKMERASRGNSLTINVLSSGIESNPRNVDEFLKLFHEFPTKGRPTLVRYHAVPYEQIIKGWPIADPFAPTTPEQKLSKLSEVIFGLQALITDAEFVKHNKDLFGLGTTDKRRQEYLSWLLKRADGFKKERDAIKAAVTAAKCDVDFDGMVNKANKGKCEALYQKYKEWDAADEYERYPDRYLSNCKGPLEIASLSLPMAAAKLTHTGRGDRAFAGHNVRFDASVRFKPDTASGGRRDQTRNLTAVVGIRMAENQPDHTTFEWNGEIKDVFKLDQPAGGLPLPQCQFHDQGVAAPLIDVGNNKKAHGAIAMVGPGPRFDKSSKGLLKAANCEIAPGDDSRPTCSTFEIQAVQLKLVNMLDVQADKEKLDGKRAGHSQSDKAKRVRVAMKRRQKRGTVTSCPANTVKQMDRGHVKCVPKRRANS